MLPLRRRLVPSLAPTMSLDVASISLCAPASSSPLSLRKRQNPSRYFSAAEPVSCAFEILRQTRANVLLALFIRVEIGRRFGDTNMVMALAHRKQKLQVLNITKSL